MNDAEKEMYRRLSETVKRHGKEIEELKKNSHVPVDFTPMLDRIAALEAKAKRK